MRRISDLLWRWRGRAGTRGVSYEVIHDVRSEALGNARDIEVCLPASYHRGTRRYPVLYMHDGQNLFHRETSFAEPWRVQDAMRVASRRGIETIVVAIPNTGEQRIDEYSPFVSEKDGGGKGDVYLDWVTQVVKPMIDERYRTHIGRDHCGMAGSSMGGLISLYAFFRPESPFGFAAALSPSLWFADGAIFPSVEAAAFAPGRLYLDAGGQEGPGVLDLARAMLAQLEAKGYDRGRNLRWVEDPRGQHRESDWGRRLAAALPFLLNG